MKRRIKTTFTLPSNTSLHLEEISNFLCDSKSRIVQLLIDNLYTNLKKKGLI